MLELFFKAGLTQDFVLPGYKHEMMRTKLPPVKKMGHNKRQGGTVIDWGSEMGRTFRDGAITREGDAIRDEEHSQRWENSQRW